MRSGEPGTEGRCRRLAPRPNRASEDKDGHLNRWASWPLTLASDWCGEYEPAKQ